MVDVVDGMIITFPSAIYCHAPVDKLNGRDQKIFKGHFFLAAARKTECSHYRDGFCDPIYAIMSFLEAFRQLVQKYI